MKFKTAILLIHTVLFFSLFSCSHWNKKEWNALENRHFTFNRFYCYSKRDKAANIYAYIKKFPAGQVFQLLEEIFSIRINADDFSSFTTSENQKDLKVDGLLFDSDFTWKNKNETHNAVNFKYIKTISEGVRGEDYIYEYELTIQSMGKVRARFSGEAYSREDIAPMLIKQLKRKSPMADTEKMPDPEDREKRLAEEKEKAKETKLKNILKDLSPEERELLKQKLQK